MTAAGSGNGDRRFARQLATVGHVGMMFPVAIALGAFAGYLLDRRLDTSPWLALAGFVLGVATAIREVVRATARMAEQERDQAARAPRGAARLRLEQEAVRESTLACEERASAEGEPDATTGDSDAPAGEEPEPPAQTRERREPDASEHAAPGRPRAPGEPER